MKKCTFPRFTAKSSTYNKGIKFGFVGEQHHLGKSNQVLPQALPLNYALCYWGCIAGGGDWVDCGGECDKWI